MHNINCPDCSAGLIDASGFGDFQTCSRCQGSGSLPTAGFTAEQVRLLEQLFDDHLRVYCKGDGAEIRAIYHVQDNVGGYLAFVVWDDYSNKEQGANLMFKCRPTDTKIEDFHVSV